VKKPMVIVDWSASFRHGEAKNTTYGRIASERESSQEVGKFVREAFEQKFIIGWFLCKVIGEHPNDERFFQKDAVRALSAKRRHALRDSSEGIPSDERCDESEALCECGSEIRKFGAIFKSILSAFARVVIPTLRTSNLESLFGLPVTSSASHTQYRGRRACGAR
jgi:hypothetical protein